MEGRDLLVTGEVAARLQVSELSSPTAGGALSACGLSVCSACGAAKRQKDGSYAPPHFSLFEPIKGQGLLVLTCVTFMTCIPYIYDQTLSSNLSSPHFL